MKKRNKRKQSRKRNWSRTETLLTLIALAQLIISALDFFFK